LNVRQFIYKLASALFFIFNFSFFISAQDTCHLRISLLTCSPGEELYSTFGHSAIRIVDSVHKDDIVYNYGTFDFDDPDFYSKFTRGKLLYYLSTEDFNGPYGFKENYRAEKRSMIEQVLNLSCSERRRMYDLLKNNLLGANKFYKYDFLFDNCTTRLRDLLEKASDSSVHFSRVVNPKVTFRQLIYEYLDRNDKQWSKLGIDMLLGARLDRAMTDREVMFLPDYLMKSFDSSRIGNKKVVEEKGNVVTFEVVSQNKSLVSNPIFIFSILLVLIVLLSASGNERIMWYLRFFDSFLFFIIGAMGILMLFMWFGTEHIMCKDNYNLLWAWPTHAVFAFYMNSRRTLKSNYFKATAVVNSVLLMLWIILPQHLNTALIPFLLIVIFRSALRGYKKF
jgi:hypothetical protein